MKSTVAHYGFFSLYKCKENQVLLNVQNAFREHTGEVVRGYMVYFKLSLLITWVSCEPVNGSWVRYQVYLDAALHYTILICWCKRYNVILRNCESALLMPDHDLKGNCLFCSFHSIEKHQKHQQICHAV